MTNPTDTFAGDDLRPLDRADGTLGVTQIGEGVRQIAEDGSETMVINPEENQLNVDPEAMVDGFTVPTNALLDPLGAGTFVMRVYRGSELCPGHVHPDRVEPSAAFVPASASA